MAPATDRRGLARDERDSGLPVQTSSTVELWIEKRVTGEVQYYQLPGATPDSVDLTSLFDRTGFRP